MIHDVTAAEALAFLRVLSGDKDVISYRPTLARMTGSVLGAIFLQQVAFRFLAPTNEYRPFYKFSSPCKHRLYRPGDSWYEELVFSRSEFDSAKAAVATKILSGGSRADVLDDLIPVFDESGYMLNAPHLVAYWTDGQRTTYYQLNAVLFGRAIRDVYIANAESSISKKANAEYDISPDLMQNPALHGNAKSNITYSTENTQRVSVFTHDGHFENSIPETEAQRQAREGVADWAPAPGQPSRGPLFDALCEVCRFNYYRAKTRPRMDFEKALSDLRDQGRTPEGIRNDFAPQWLTYWRCTSSNGRRPTPAEVVELYDDVVTQAVRAAEVAAANLKSRGGNNGKQTNADRLREAAEILT